MRKARRRAKAKVKAGTGAIPNDNPNRVLTFHQWCMLNGFSFSTGRRIIAAGTGPVVTQLSPRRIGVTIGNNLAWLESRARSAAA